MKVVVHEMSDQDQKLILDFVDPFGEMFREVVIDLIANIADRIHHKGLAADGTQIGTYSEAYMKVRTGEVKRRPNATNLKTKKTFSTKPKFNRTSDTKVILSLTRQMENDYVPVAGPKGWGVGFTNPHNFDKATWNNDPNRRYKKIVYDLTTEELERVIRYTEELITDELS